MSMRMEDILHEPGNELMKFSPPSDRMPVPGFVDCFLATATAGWKGAGTLLRRFVTDWKEANGIPVERSPEAEAALAEIPEEDRERYDRAETEADVISQRETIEAERYSDFLYERAGIAGTLGTFAGRLADPVVLAEGAATAPLMGPIGEAVAGFAGFASRSLGVKVGFEGLLKGTAAGKILKAAGHGGTSAAIFSLIDAGRKKYIGVPIENLGVDVGWNSLLGACLGGIGSSIGMFAGKLRANRTELKESFGESIMSDFSPSDIEVVADADGNVTGATINGKKTSSLAKYCSFSPTSIGVYSNNSVLKRITLASFNTNHEGAPAITTEYRYALQINKGETAASEINKLKELAIKSGRVASPERFDDICFSAMTTGTPSGIPEIDKAALITGRKYFDSMRDLGLELRLFDRALGKRYIFPEGSLDDLVQQAVMEGKGGETVAGIRKNRDALKALNQAVEAYPKEYVATLNKINEGALTRADFETAAARSLNRIFNESLVPTEKGFTVQTRDLPNEFLKPYEELIREANTYGRLLTKKYNALKGNIRDESTIAAEAKHETEIVRKNTDRLFEIVEQLKNTYEDIPAGSDSGSPILKDLISFGKKVKGILRHNLKNIESKYKKEYEIISNELNTKLKTAESDALVAKAKTGFLTKNKLASEKANKESYAALWKASDLWRAEIRKTSARLAKYRDTRIANINRAAAAALEAQRQNANLMRKVEEDWRKKLFKLMKGIRKNHENNIEALNKRTAAELKKHRLAGGREYKELLAELRRSNEEYEKLIPEREKELRELLKRERPLLQEDLDEAVRESGNARYAPIVFDAVKIRDNPAAFRDTMVRCLMRYDRMTERAALNTVEDMITRIYGGEQSGYFPILRARAGKAGATKERVFRIPSTELIDFLVTDPERLIRHQARTFGYDIAEAQTLRELGFQSWEAVMAGVSEEAARQGFPKGTEKILKYARQIPFIIKGQINPPPITFGDRLLNASIQSMKTLNYVTLMGKVILGCAEDFAMTFAKRGLFRHIGELLNYRKTPHFFSKEELKMFGICLDDVSKTPYGFMDTFSDFARKGVRTFGRMTGVPQFENLRAGFLANLTAKDLSRAILEGATSVPGLKESEVNTIRGMLQKHAVKDGKLVTDLQLSLWDEDAAILFMGKIRRMVSQYIVRPNAGDMPLFLRKPAGQMFSMFTSWAFALHNQILLPLLESGKHAELAKMMVYGFGLGFLTEQIRSYIRGEVPDATDPQFLERVVTRMPLGVFGLLGEYIADLSRKENQSARNMIYTLAKKGNLRYPLELFDVAHYPFREQPLTEKERRRALALIPFNNLLYINPIVNYFTADK